MNGINVSCEPEWPKYLQFMKGADDWRIATNPFKGQCSCY